MKTKTALFLLSIVLYLICFYEQNPGLNYLLFAPWLLISQVIIFPEVLKKINWWLCSVATLLTAFGIWYTNSYLAIGIHLFMVSCTAMTILGSNSMLVQLFSTVFNWFWNIPGMIIDYMNYRKGNNNKLVHYILLSIIPLLITLVFIFLYSSANPVFEWLLDKIDLSFIKLNLIVITLYGIFLMYLFFFPKKNEVFMAMEFYMPNGLTSTDYKNSPFSKNEYLSGIILLSMLNLVLMLFNIVDFITYFATDKLPEGMTNSGLVHQGVYTLIFSIILAIGIILYFYRGNQNYNPNKTLLSLALIWIIQNIIMVFVIFWKNGLYIQEYGLTYKRIGVYIWLGLCVGGLITTLIKIAQKKSIFYLLKSNVAITFFTLSLVLSYNWDRTIAWYNLNYCRQENADLYYLLGLSSSVYPEVSEYLQKHELPIPYELYNNMKFRYELEHDEAFMSSNHERKRITEAWEALSKYYEKQNNKSISTYNYLIVGKNTDVRGPKPDTAYDQR